MGPEEFTHYVRSGRSRLRCGYTTGTCAALAAEVSRLTGIPVVCHTAEARLLDQLRDLDPFPMESRMKKPWEIL